LISSPLQVVGWPFPESGNAMVNQEVFRFDLAVFRSYSADIPKNGIWGTIEPYPHIVIGVHGSNTLLKSAHVGSMIELVPHNRWSNMGEDIFCSVGNGAYKNHY
jgi:hypothetical protein